MFKTLEKYPILVICLLVAILLLPNLNTLQVTIMEARNFITAREMILDSNWLLTTMNDEARYQKPPLPTWLSAVSGMVFGMKSLFAMRLPAVLMVMIVGSFIFYLSQIILKNKLHSLINALIVITSFYVIGIIIEAPWDIFTHGFMLIAVYYLFKLFESNTKQWKHTFVVGFCIGLSIMCKGPVSIYALLLPFLIAYGITYKYKNIRSKILQIISILTIALLIGGWWYLYVRFQDPETFNAIASKETGNWTSYNVRPFYYYWSFFTQSGLWTIPAFISLLYPYLKKRVSNSKAYRFSFLWTILVVILLSIIPEKKSRYLMPVLIPLSINIGFYIEYLFRKFKTMKDKRETFPVYFNFGLIALIAIAFPIIIYVLFKNQLSDHWLLYSLTSIITVVIGILIFLQLKQKNIKHVFLLTIIFYATLLLLGIPLSKAFISDNYKSISSLKTELFDQNLNIYGINTTPETIWQFGDKIPILDLNNESYSIPTEKQFALLINGDETESIKKLSKNYNIKHIREYDLNQTSKKSKQYKKRLFSNYYLVTKK